MAKKTKLMRRIDAQQGRPLERFLPDRINQVGLTACAEELDVSKATPGYWMLKLGVEVRRVVVRSGETIVIHKSPEFEED